MRSPFASGVGLTAVLACAAAVTVGVSAPTAAADTPSAPTLVTSWTPAEIGVNDSSGVAYTLTDPNASGSLLGVGFSDSLPAGTTTDDPAGLSSSGCGSSDTIAVNSGSSTMAASGITIKAGTPCVISFSVSAYATGINADQPGPLTYFTQPGGAQQTAPSANETPATLTVLAPPTARISTPGNHRRFRFGQRVKVAFLCTAPSDANGPTLTGCLASDDAGNTIRDGGYLDTRGPGQHTLSLQALDSVGDSANAQIEYTVLADDVVTVTANAPTGHGGVRTILAVPGAGRVTVTLSHGRTVYAEKAIRLAGRARALGVRLAPTAAGAKLLAAAKLAKRPLKLVETIAYRPEGGVARTIRRVLRVG